ncbi:hypothetical protein CISIN_1g039274mg, partial [Citrus sinensis]
TPTIYFRKQLRQKKEKKEKKKKESMEDYCRTSSKSSWPELVGVKGEVAAEIIMRENGKVVAIIVKEGFEVTMDYRCDRVWVWVDHHGIVKYTPRIG